MNPDLKHSMELMISHSTGRQARIRDFQAAGGGCINDSQTIELEDGRRYFVKSNPRLLPGMFPAEAEGLNALAEAGIIRVPRALGTGGEPGSECPDCIPFIVMEHVERGTPGPGFFRNFGRQFAEFHRATRHDQFGFENDNYLGSTPQPNSRHHDWVEFWRENRLGFQLELASRNGYADRSMMQLGERLMDRLTEEIGQPAESACLLHGDLWGGNYLAGENGEAVLIDPAAYFGRREADLAMTMLFGGFHDDFYRAYHETWPLENGFQDRIEIYKLYHLLNHLNLFGSSYSTGCMSILRKFS
jgi:protein-ribulosamine 3-kinase